MSGRERWAELYESTRGFSVSWILTVAILAGLVYPVAVAAWYNNVGNTNADWVHHLFIRKEAALQLAGDAPRSLVVGGSGCLFSLDAESMERELKQPVINLCSHAGVGLEYMLARARRHARAGDTVILMPEYRVLSTPDASQTRIEWDYFTTWDRRHYLEHGLPEAYRMLYSIPFGDLWKSREGRRQLWKGYQDKLHEIYDVTLMTANGDLHESLGNRPVLLGKLELTFLPPVELSHRLIHAFAQWARDHGVRVFAAYQPAALDPPDYWRKSDYFAMLPGWWKEMGIEPLGTPEEALWPSAGFMDSMQHAGPGVSYAHAVQLARVLRHDGAAKERLLVPAHPAQPLLPLPSRPGAAVKVYFATVEEDNEIRSFQQTGGRVYVATSALAEQLRTRGFGVNAAIDEFTTPDAVVRTHRDKIIAICVRPDAPTIAGLEPIVSGTAGVGIWQHGHWHLQSGSDRAEYDEEFNLPLVTGEPIGYRFALRAARDACELQFQRRDRATSPAAVVRMLVLDPRRGILQGVYNFNGDLRAEVRWLGEIATR
ncbi:MAG: hypothetical protein ACKV2U_26325 [Bryobacteraceae bacterium]